MRFHKNNLRWLFASADAAVNAALQRMNPSSIYGASGAAVPVVMDDRGALSVLQEVAPGFDRAHPNCLMLGISGFWYRVPFFMLLPEYEDITRMYVLYRLSIHSALPDNVGLQFSNGYHGITRRSPLVRFKEHHTAAKRGEGFLLHSSWHSLYQHGVEHTPIFSLVRHGRRLADIYKAEEIAVEAITLAPKGLNAIPGGEAGIKMLHELSLLKGKRLPAVHERDAAVERMLAERSSPSAHLRSRHLREYDKNKFTWVRECLVGAKEAAHA